MDPLVRFFPSRQVAESNSFFWDRKQGYGLAKLKGEDSTNQIETCAKCHARRGGIQEGFCGGKSFTDYYSPELLTEQTYHDDGQIKDEVYVYGSFVQSRMYASGVVCGDCHDPHTLELRFEGNALCSRCHLPETFDQIEHHYHIPGSEGAHCVTCHMADRVYMGVDPRRDHSMRVPRPEEAERVGAPGVCDRCHADKATGYLWD